MATNFLTTIWNAFYWMKMYKLWLRFHWSFFPGVQLTIFQHWFRKWLGVKEVTSHYLNQWWLVYWCLDALCLNELTHYSLGGMTANSEVQFSNPSYRIVAWTVDKIIVRWKPQNLTNGKSTLVQVMACCLTQTSHYLSQGWPRFMQTYGISMPQWVKPILNLGHG